MGNIEVETIIKHNDYEKANTLFDGIKPECAWDAGTRETSIYD